MRRVALVVIALTAMALSARADAVPLTLEGDTVQGGLMLGRTDPGTTVLFEGREIRVSPDGQFVIGFTRDAKPSATLELRAPDGGMRTEKITVKKRDYKIQRIDGLPPKMVTPPKSVLDRIRRENRMIRKARSQDTGETLYLSGWIWPSTGRISGVYGSQRILNGKPRQPHYGIDIAAPTGTPVVAPSDGIVSLVETDLYYTGGTIILDHGHGLSSAFLHMKDVIVKKGQRVRQGEKIGTVGSTGRSTGAHLDWRINLFDARIDPALLVPPMKARQK